MTDCITCLTTVAREILAGTNHPDEIGCAVFHERAGPHE